MTKLVKIIGRTIGILTEWLLVCFVVFCFVIRLSSVQTYFAQFAADYLSKELHTKVRIGKLAVLFLDKIALQDVYVEDQNGHPIASISTIYAKIHSLNLSKNKLKIHAIEFDKGYIHVSREKKTGDYNYWFITDYFASDGGGGKNPKTFIDEVKLHQITVQYDDYRWYYSTFGMDYDHLLIKNIDLAVENISIIHEDIRGTISHLKASEKCGFIVNDFSGICHVNNKGVRVKNLRINTPNSVVVMPKFEMLYDYYECVYAPEDSLFFNAKINPSRVSLKDISYFATYLEGMDEIVFLEANVSKRVKDLRIANLNLKFGQKSVLQGTLNLPDFRSFRQAFFQEKLTYAYLNLTDLEHLKLPKDEGGGYFSFDKYVERLNFIEAKNLRLDGFYHQFVVAANRLNTGIGSFKFDNGIMFTENKVNDSYFFERSDASEYDVKIEKFQLNKFIEDDNFGEVDGTVFLSGEAFSLAKIHFNEIQGQINHFDYLGYAYKNVQIESGKFVDNRLDAKIEIKDENLAMKYDGYIDFNDNQHMYFTVDLGNALLNELNLNHIDGSKLSSNFTFDLYGKTSNTLYGTIRLNELKYSQAEEVISVPSLTVNVTRSPEEDILSVRSNVLNATIVGKVDFNTLQSDFENQFSKIFPAIIKPTAQLAVRKKKNKSKQLEQPQKPSHFEYNLELKEVNSLLHIFIPDLQVAKGTKFIGNYDKSTEFFSMKITSPQIIYDQLYFNKVSVQQRLNANEIDASYLIDDFRFFDSIHLNQLSFKTKGTQDTLFSTIQWNPNSNSASTIVWKTKVNDLDNFSINLLPSYVVIKESKWNLLNNSDISIAGKAVGISNFLLECKDQYISLNGKFSENDAERIRFKIHNLELQEVSNVLNLDYELKGVFNGWGYLSNPYSNLAYLGDANVHNLFVDNQQVGDVYFQSQWDKQSKSFALMGDMLYKGFETFTFDGHYFPERKLENIDFNLIFDHTDIKFTNAFMDPDVLSNIAGNVDGRLKLGGTIEKPELSGAVNLIDGSARVDIMGVDYKLNGRITTDAYGIYIDNMPITDQEGNTGSVSGSIYHQNFYDWNFDLLFNLEDDYLHKSPLTSWKPAPLERFLLMNTTYKQDDVYYGKGYGTGSVNVFGYTDNIEITVNTKTAPGTKVYFPMYETNEVEDEQSAFVFKQKDTTQVVKKDLIDFTGVELDLNFEITPDAEIRVLFDESNGDEINTRGNGNINVKLNNMDDIEMAGTFNVKSGIYNFVLGSLTKPLIIQQGSITWTKDPYDAYIDLKTYFDVKANLNELNPDKTNTSAVSYSAVSDIYCYVNLTETLMKPAISFDIRAPKATSEGTMLLNRVTQDPVELNKQFFSLLLWSKFQTLQNGTSGNSIGGSSAALDMASNKINQMLAQVSKDYKLKVNLDADANGNTMSTFGVSKKMLDNRLTISTNFGVENIKNSSSVYKTTTSQNAFIGEVNIDYSMNESGTFRLNVFNVSNNNTIDKVTAGYFTQGVGVHYQEEFDNIENFKLVQYTLDLFRPSQKKRFPEKRKRKQTPIPTE